MMTRLCRFLMLVGGAACLALLALALAAPGADEPVKGATAKIRAGDRLYIQVDNALPYRPIGGVYRVEPSGKVPLGPAYGRALVAGLTLEEAEAKVGDHLKRVIARPMLSVTWYDPVAHGGP